MDIVEYKQLDSQKIISFIRSAHKNISKTIDLNGKDADLLDLETHYGTSNVGFWCVLENNQIIGTVGLRSVQKTNNTCAEIRRLYIQPQWQNKGIGSRLIDFVINHAKLNGFKLLSKII